MEIVDITGRIIETMSTPILEMGSHQFHIHIADAGIYFLTARQNGETSSIKIVNNGRGTENRIESMDQIIQYPVTSEGYANFLKRIRNLKTRGYEVKIGVESTGNTRYFKTQVEKAGAEVTVINTLKFKIINESTKKTDKHELILDVLFLYHNRRAI